MNIVQESDEFYTRREDAEKIISAYSKFLKGKSVWCSCDDPQSSEIYSVLKEKFNELQLKQIYCSIVKKAPAVYTEYGEGFIKHKIWEGHAFDINEIKKYDVILTNPPFSRFSDLIKACDTAKTDFILVASKKSLITSYVYDKIVNGTMFCESANAPEKFKTPDNQISRVPTAIITSFPIQKRKLSLTKQFNSNNYDKINNGYLMINRVSDIPADYKDEMAVPGTILFYDFQKYYNVIGLQRHINYNNKKDLTRIIIKRKF